MYIVTILIVSKILNLLSIVGILYNIILKLIIIIYLLGRTRKSKDENIVSLKETF